MKSNHADPLWGRGGGGVGRGGLTVTCRPLSCLNCVNACQHRLDLLGKAGLHNGLYVFKPSSLEDVELRSLWLSVTSQSGHSCSSLAALYVWTPALVVVQNPCLATCVFPEGGGGGRGAGRGGEDKYVRYPRVTRLLG